MPGAAGQVHAALREIDRDVRALARAVDDDAPFRSVWCRARCTPCRSSPRTRPRIESAAPQCQCALRATRSGQIGGQSMQAYAIVLHSDGGGEMDERQRLNQERLPARCSPRACPGSAPRSLRHYLEPCVMRVCALREPAATSSASTEASAAPVASSNGAITARIGSSTPRRRMLPCVSTRDRSPPMFSEAASGQAGSTTASTARCRRAQRLRAELEPRLTGAPGRGGSSLQRVAIHVCGVGHIDAGELHRRVRCRCARWHLQHIDAHRHGRAQVFRRCALTAGRMETSSRAADSRSPAGACSAALQATIPHRPAAHGRGSCQAIVVASMRIGRSSAPCNPVRVSVPGRRSASCAAAQRSTASLRLAQCAVSAATSTSSASTMPARRRNAPIFIAIRCRQ